MIEHPGALRVGNAAQVRELDRRATREFGVPSDLLMEAAGRRCADEAQTLVADFPGPIAILCGPGNNGGDGLVIARTLHNRGFGVRPVLVGRFAARDRLGADVRANLERLEALGVEPRYVAGEGDLDAVKRAVDGVALGVDALFGTGLSRPLEPPFSTALDLFGEAEAPILAVDLPSGLDADSGELLGPVVGALSTVTFACWKRGLLHGHGPSLAGMVTVAEIGIPRALVEALPGVLDG